MNYEIFVKNDFLNQTVGQFSSNMGLLSFNDVKNLILKNTSWYINKKAVNSFFEKNNTRIYNIFSEIDGRTLNRDAILDKKEIIPLKRRDGYIEKQEIYQFIKDYYRCEKNIRLTDEEVSKMKLDTLLDIIVILDKIHMQSQKKK